MNGLTGKATGRMTMRPGAADAILDKSGAAQRLLDKKAAEAKAFAEALWETRSRHESSPPVYYGRSFKIRRTKGIMGRPARQLVNTDSEWFFVEYGVGHGAGKPGYKYRILGTTLDAMVAGGLL